MVYIEKVKGLKIRSVGAQSSEYRGESNYGGGRPPRSKVAKSGWRAVRVQSSKSRLTVKQSSKRVRQEKE